MGREGKRDENIKGKFAREFRRRDLSIRRVSPNIPEEFGLELIWSLVKSRRSSLVLIKSSENETSQTRA